MRRLHAKRAGDVVYVGPGRVGDAGMPVQTPVGLRVTPDGIGRCRNVGLTRIGLRRSPSDPELWDVFVSARNYTSQPRTFLSPYSSGARRSAIRC